MGTKGPGARCGPRTSNAEGPAHRGTPVARTDRDRSYFAWTVTIPSSVSGWNVQMYW